MTKADSDLARSLLAHMGQQSVPPPPPDEEAALQRRTAAHVEGLLFELNQRRSPWRRRARWVSAAAALAAACAGVWFFSAKIPSTAHMNGAQLRSGNGTVLVSHPGEPAAAASIGARFAQGDALRTTSNTHAELRLSDEAAVALAPDTALVLAVDTPNDERVDLNLGSVSLHVPKLGPGHTLSVRTPDTIVTVRGTRFSVGVRPRGDEVTTSVSVSEGRVQVDHGGRTLFLTAGESWTSEPTAAVVQNEPRELVAAAPTSSTSATATVATPRHATKGASPAVATSQAQASVASVLAPNSSLADENTLFERALKQSRAGDIGALRQLDTLIQEHPASPLVQNARVERFRLLARTGNTAAAAKEARRYLSDYPDGFARIEAKQLVLSRAASP